MKKSISIILITFIVSMLEFCVAAELTARTFQKAWDTAESPSDIWGAVTGSYSILDMISLVNRYLWFAIWFFCFVFMIWNWFKLISANWDEKAVWSAKKALIWSVVWIVVCLLAYIIVNLAVKIFR